MTKEVFPLFSSPLVVCRNFLDVSNLDMLKNYYCSNTNIWQDFYNKNLTHNVQTISKKTLDTFPDIKQLFEEDFNELAATFLQITDETVFKIGSSWGHKAKPFSIGRCHTHSNYFWSAVFYLQDSNTAITFFKNISGYDFSFKVKKETLYNSSGFKFTPTENTLIYFPSYLSHSVDEHSEQQNRYSIAMNFTPTGVWGYSDSEIALNASV